MILTWFWVRFWIYLNKMFGQRFAKALFLKSFGVCNFWTIWFWFFLTDPYIEHIMTWNQAYIWCSKNAEQNFSTHEDPRWALNYNWKTFLKSTKPIVLLVSDRTLQIPFFVCHCWVIVLNFCTTHEGNEGHLLPVLFIT